MERKKYVDKVEKDQLKECFVQNVTQCYYTYITEYSEAEQEKCVDFYWKTCKIVFKERVFNATSRTCKRPLIKKCDDNTGYNAVEPKIVCETFFETACNTTHVVPAPGDEPLPGTCYCNIRCSRYASAYSFGFFHLLFVSLLLKSAYSCNYSSISGL